MKPQRFSALLLAPGLMVAALAGTAAKGPLGPSYESAQSGQGRSLKELQAEIDGKRGQTPREVFEQLGEMKTEAAYKVLKASASELKGRAAKTGAFGAMRHLLSNGKLKKRVLAHITETALRGRRGDAQAVVQVLQQFGEPGRQLLWRVLSEAEDARVRRFAFAPIYDELSKERDTEVREATLRDFVVPQSGSEDQMLALLRLQGSPEDLKRFKEVVMDKRQSISTRRMVIRAMEAHVPAAEDGARSRPEKPDPAGAVILGGLESDEPRLLFQALLTASLRPAPIDGITLRRVKKHAKSKDDATRRAATLLLLQKGDGKLDPLRLADSRDPMLRQAAAIALGNAPGDDSFQALTALAVDKNWTVRVEAIRGLEAQRDRRAILFLVERINREEGRLVADLAAALESVTGRGYGKSPKTWRRFWNKEGKEFEMPSREQAADAAQARAALKEEKQQANGASVSSFYGLQVISERFAIVFDASLSMDKNGASGKRRIDTAKAQLTGTLESLGEGTLVNLIPFAAVVDPLWDEVMPLNKNTRAEALAFTKDLSMKLGTDVYDGLYTAFLDEQIDTIYVLSDGASTEGVVKDALGLREVVARWNSVRGIKIHCIGIGTDHPLLRGLSSDSGGSYLRVD